MLKHKVKVNGIRYFVFNDDYYNSSGGLFDCELITDDFEEAEKLAIEISKKEYYPENSSVFDVTEKVYYVYVNGKKVPNEFIDFI